MIPLLVAASLAGPPAAPVVGCDRRIEGGRQVSDSLPADVEIGPIRFTGLRWAATASRADLTPSPGPRWRVWKATPVVDAGRAVTVVVAPADRPRLQLSWQGGSGPAVTFRPCPSGTKAFSYPGTVGPHTAFAGGFLVDGPGCRRLQVWVQGRSRPFVRVISFAAGRCR
ncbi:MAG TPA: hypothetical protein VFA66_01180 [Gaiellaceae bacterium]|nr:hypothetical protein [Gaiellaceae bacterium]